MPEIVDSPNNHRFRVIKKVANSKHYRIHLCEEEDTERQCLLQIAIEAKDNGKLQRAAYVLDKLGRHADMLEKEYEKVKADSKFLLNYQLGFPELVDSFIYREQGGRQVNVLAFSNVEKVAEMVPLKNITAKNHLRIDLRTSAWIMGKILKLLDFAYSQDIAVGLVTGENILVNTEKHYAVIFDWMEAKTFDEEVPKETKRREISQAACAVIIALGGNMKTGFFPESGCEEYVDFLLQMARGSMSAEVGKIYDDFYAIVDRTWERKFYPFTVVPLETDIVDKTEE